MFLYTYTRYRFRWKFWAVLAVWTQLIGILVVALIGRAAVPMPPPHVATLAQMTSDERGVPHYVDDLIVPEAPAPEAAFFRPEDVALMDRVCFCERGPFGDTAVNPASTASGYCGILATTWEGVRAAGVGVQPFYVGRFDRNQNMRVASWLLYHTPQGIHHWDASRKCWGA